MKNIILDPDIKIIANKKGISLKRDKRELVSWKSSSANDLNLILNELKNNGISTKNLRELPLTQRGLLSALISIEALVFDHVTKSKKTIVTEAWLSGTERKKKSPTLKITEKDGLTSLSAPFSGKILRVKGSIADLFAKSMREDIRDVLTTLKDVDAENDVSQILMDSLMPLLPKGKAAPAGEKKTSGKHIPFPTDLKEEKTFSTISSRTFTKAVSFQDLASLLHVAAGSKNRPSAGALYETGIFVSVHDVKGLKPGMYEMVKGGLVKRDVSHDLLTALLSHARFSLQAKKDPHAVIWLAPDMKAIREIYRNISVNLALLNAGVLLDRIYLAAKTLGIEGCAIGRERYSLELQKQKVLSDDQFITCGYAL